ncbi:DUF5994 family protein [Amycolatopsis sp. NPDC051102]|uniref:DUF5994 family protein n=1 Tax=Amycolatopsis sp. NPDC051102 TaxID=3155163 RepID=UPI00341B2326
MKPAAAAAGHVDGAWWPRTSDLTAELPALFTALVGRLGRIDRVTYSLGDWPASPRRVTFDEGVVRLEGFRSQPSGSVTVIGWNRHRTTLSVVPPATSPDVAERVLTTAADPGNTDDNAQLLAAAPTGREQTPGGIPVLS